MAVTAMSSSPHNVINPFHDSRLSPSQVPNVNVYDDEKGSSSYVVCGSEYRELLKIAREHVTVMKKLFQIKRTANNPDWGAVYWDCRQGMSLEDARAVSGLVFKDGLTFYKVLDTGHRSEEIQNASVHIMYNDAEIYNAANNLHLTFSVRSMVEMYHDPLRRVLVIVFQGYSFEIVCYEQATLRALYFAILMRHEDDQSMTLSSTRPDPVAATEKTVFEATPRQWNGANVSQQPLASNFAKVPSQQTVGNPNSLTARAANVSLPKSQGTLWTAAVSQSGLQSQGGVQQQLSNPHPSRGNSVPVGSGFVTQQEVPFESVAQQQPQQPSHFVSQHPPSQWSQPVQQQQSQPFMSQPIVASGVYGVASPVQSKNTNNFQTQAVDSHIPTIQLAPPSGSNNMAHYTSTTSWGGTPPVTPMVAENGQRLQPRISSQSPKNTNPSMASVNTVAQQLSVVEQQSQLARIQQQLSDTPDL